MSERRMRPWLARAVAEAALVVFAVLLALAVDEWREDRAMARLAERTTESVAGEIRRNRAELVEEQAAGTGSPAVLAALDSAIATIRDGGEPKSISANWNVSLLSSAAWETAQLTRATQHMDLDRVIQLAEVYELQRFFSRNQDELASLISDFGARMETEPVVALTQVRSRLAVTAGLRGTLATVYACTLVELEGPDAVEAGACPRGEG
ncbi:MAG: hypothetical protein PVI57_19215 [Gemmatimonadota bacterium]